MSFFDQIYGRLFGKHEKSTQSMLINDLLKRSESFLERFNAWKKSETCAELMNDLLQSYDWQKQGVDKDPHMLLLESTYSNGFAISYEDKYGKSSYRFLLDYLADQVKKLDYRLVMSRRTLQDKNGIVESKEMHYLKPKTGFVEPIDQKYGNVQIEYIEENDQPTRVKLIVNSYPDRKYKTAKSFEDLAHQILTFK